MGGSHWKNYALSGDRDPNVTVARVLHLIRLDINVAVKGHPM